MAIRFRAYGKRRYVALGTSEECWDRPKAEAELRHVLADVERGIWQPPASPTVPKVREVPSFHVLASEWLRGREPELRPRTIEDYRWLLSYHLLPFFRTSASTRSTSPRSTATSPSRSARASSTPRRSTSRSTG